MLSFSFELISSFLGTGKAGKSAWQSTGKAGEIAGKAG
jgi:hypothetical protein